jgi:hypothetical protein
LKAKKARDIIIIVISRGFAMLPEGSSLYTIALAGFVL